MVRKRPEPVEAPPWIEDRGYIAMTRSRLSGAVVRIKTRDEYDGMLGKVCGTEDSGEMLVVKHRPIAYPHRRNTTLHCFRRGELEVLRS